MAKKYFKCKVGTLVSNGALKYRFAVPVVAIDSDDPLAGLFTKSLLAVEVTKKEADEVSKGDEEKVDDKGSDDADKEDEGNAGSDEGNAKEDAPAPEGLDAMTVKELKAHAEKLGVVEADIKATKNRDEILALTKSAEEGKYEAPKPADDEEDGSDDADKAPEGDGEAKTE